MPSLPLIVGSSYWRRELHDAYGGNRQAGISYAPEGTVMMLFSKPAAAAEHGYPDGWGTDGHYHYCGEGTTGDQSLANPRNAAILNHQAQGRTLHLFFGHRSAPREYLGQFRLAEQEPYYLAESPGADAGALRSIIFFRLAPLGEFKASFPLIDHTPSHEPRVEDVTVEAHHTERTVVVHPEREQELVRREAPLVQRYREFLEQAGKQVTRKKITPPGERYPHYTDLFNSTDGQLVEAKATITREAVRMGIGQLLDYRRFIDPVPSMALLLPQQPRPDLLHLCASAGVTVIWPDQNTYHSTAHTTSSPTAQAAAG
ncbi:restriction endonuclease [Kitasatospora sp. NPDC049258]|uniref:restriction endonuclease n=1 Tax=Kitasatospora sp. NPDC049258 TaxID=3155394 RepID=UPI0034228929